MRKALLLFAFLCALAIGALAQSIPATCWQEADLSPRVCAPVVMTVTNGTLTCTGKRCSLSTGGGGGGSPGGVTGDYQINSAGSFAAGVIAQGSTGRLTMTPTAASSGVAPYVRIITPADTGQTANTNFPGIFLGGNASGATVTRTGADGTTYALQEEVVIVEPTYAFAGATTITDACTLCVRNRPQAGTNATITNAYSILATGLARFDFHTTNSGASPSIFLNSPAGSTFSAMDFGINNATTYRIDVDSSGNIVFGRTGTGTFSVRNTSQANFVIQTSGNNTLGVGGNAAGASATLHVTSLATGSIAQKIASANGSTVDLAQFNLNADDTSTVANLTTFGANSNGTAANGFGLSHTYTLESSTTNDQNAALESVLWTNATHANRSAAYAIQLVDNAAALAEKWRISGNGAATGTTETLTNASGSTLKMGMLEENVTLSTVGATTDSTIDLPAGSIIVGVTARITTTIAGINSTALQVGDPTTAARFGTTGTFTAGTTIVGITAMDGNISTVAAGPTQAATAKVRLTLTGGADNTPSAGAVRVVIHFITLTAPTS